jgi:UTP--glucose-1-phosphate uridylyltransferase
MTIKTVVLPVAGNGTRMLPATKAVPKELLPVYDTPVLQFALDEAVAAGAQRIVLVSHHSKAAIEDYILRGDELAETLRQKGKVTLLQRLEQARVPSSVEVRMVFQDAPKGLGHAILCAKDACLPGPVGVILPDDVVMGGQCLAKMARVFDPSRMQSLIASLEVTRDEISSYGVFDFDGSVAGYPRRARGFVEKPSADEAPSLHAAIGRYILDDCIFEHLARTDVGAGGEIQLTDAISACGDIFAMPIDAPRFDCGSHEGLFEASQYQRSLRNDAEPLAIAAE